MGVLYIEQTDLTITLLTSKVLEPTYQCFMCTKSPSGVINEYVASITNTATGEITYHVTNTDVFNESGNWSIWAKIIDVQGLISIGEARKYTFRSQGN